MINTSIRTLTAWLALALGSGSAFAVTGPDVARSARVAHAPEIEVKSGPAARMQPAMRWNRVPGSASRAWNSFVTITGQRWQSLWDMDTGVPSRIFGAGILMPGSVASSERAAAYARTFLAEHIDLLAPGARAEDFVIVTNHLGHDMRTIGMVQHYQGMRVLGGQVSFRFKRDRLFVIASEALPHVNAAAPDRSLDPVLAQSNARSWVMARRSDIGAIASARAEASVWASASDGPYILPIVSRGSISYQTVARVTVEERAPMGRWHVYVDALTGEPVARKQMLRFAEGAIEYNVPERYPGGPHINAPARDTSILIDTVPAATNGSGLLSWLGDQSVTVRASVSGPLVNVVNQTGDTALQSFVLAPSGIARWIASSDEKIDAQLTTFIHARVAKDFARTIAPELAFLDQELQANVNIDDTCNAFSDGYTINFFEQSGICENTGRLPDVVYHEFGHVLHNQALLEGVGAFDGAFSEGLSDYLAAAITGDPGMGRGFFFDANPLRNIDPVDDEYRWPDDIAEIHFTGLIFAGAMWDLRKGLVAAYGEQDGVALANRLFYAAVQRAINIPSTYVEILAADDDDGNLENGTPNECLINDTFGRKHGLRSLGADIEPLGVQPPERDGYEISLRVTGTSARCPNDEVASVALQWGLRGDGEDALASEIVLDNVDGVHIGIVPRQPDGSVVRYRVKATLVDGSSYTFPTNLADPAYEFYVGNVVELYCTDFESNVYQSNEWTQRVLEGSLRILSWEWGSPAGLGVDPKAAFSGTGMIGTDIGIDAKDGFYPNNSTGVTQSPVIDVNNYSDVRLQYRRWLTVEDALYDHASIYSNGTMVWRNLDTEDGATHHLDTEWVFHDVPLSQGILDGTVQVAFEINSDQGLEFGGWNIDDLCVVANPSSICGDGQITGAETCDEGGANSDTAANACRTNCRVAACGDGIQDQGEACDDGNAIDEDGCSSLCEATASADGCAACSAGQSGPPPWPLMLFVLLALRTVVFRQRRGPETR